MIAQTPKQLDRQALITWAMALAGLILILLILAELGCSIRGGSCATDDGCATGEACTDGRCERWAVPDIGPGPYSPVRP